MVTRSTYLPRRDAGKVPWLNNFAKQKKKYATLLRFSVESVQQTFADAAMWAFLVQHAETHNNNRKGWTSYKNLVRDGTIGKDPGPVPEPTALPDPPTVVPAGIFKRVHNDVATIKRRDGYTEAIGKAMGIIRPQDTFDPTTYSANLKAEVFDRYVLLKFLKDGVHAVSIYCRIAGETVWKRVDTATRSPFKDKRPNQQPGQPEVREYMAIGVMANQELGTPSAIVRVVVG